LTEILNRDEVISVDADLTQVQDSPSV